MQKTKNRIVKVESRSYVAEMIFKAAAGYFVKKNYGVNKEVGVNRRGKLRVDLLAINRKGHIVVCEIKSCKEDFYSDTKLFGYRQFCNQMYIVVLDRDVEHLLKKKDYLLDNNIGILSLCTNPTDKRYGLVFCSLKSANLKMKKKLKHSIWLRMAWRNALFSKRNSRRNRIYLQKEV